eukprot:CAMPEP_0115850752 /NCGR_PEP_ID=MMETSP0287-20121206/12128_1 /TAXON_ID=412157 /ORGANISM="Chrysochromulina rotalis, Strain UIO044" /LENGTH=310 /DNA_ID=CAMNT_0003304763 /DNA_START=77 /DNA_END=1009 /DNA_ORIENTATION=+
MAVCSEFVVFGRVEVDRDGNVPINGARFALMSKNPRRNLLSELVLHSCNSGCLAFVLPSDKSSCTMTVFAPGGIDDVAKLSNLSNDFVMLRTVRDASVAGAEAGWREAPLFSNNKRCSHFVMANGLSSTMMTTADVLWMERVSNVPPGTLFKQIYSREQTSAAELPWEPCARFNALSKTFREKRGAKTVEHLEVLRKSDPLNNLANWPDWSEVYAQIRSSHAYEVHQDAIVRRAMLVFRRRNSPSRFSPIPEHEDIGKPAKKEREESSKSIMVLLPSFVASPEISPEMGLSKFREPADEPSPIGIESVLF